MIFDHSTKRVLVCLFLSSALSFIFPLFIPLLIEAGLSPDQSAIVQSFALFFSALASPFAGRALDHRKEIYVFSFAALGLSLGATGMIFPTNLSPIIVAVCGCAVVTSLACVNLSAKRLSEGLAQRENLTAAASWTYMVENGAGLVSAALAFYLIASFKKELLLIDISSTLIFLTYLFFLYRVNRNTVSEKKTVSMAERLENLKVVRGVWLFSLPLLLTAFCHLSALPLLYNANDLDSKTMMAAMYAANTSTVVLFSFLKAKFFRPNLRIETLVAVFALSIGHAIAPHFLSITGIVFTTFIWSIGESFAYPLVTRLIVGQFDKSQAGLAVGVRDLVLRGTLVASPLLAITLPLSDVRFFSLFYGIVPLVSLLGLGMNFLRR